MGTLKCNLFKNLKQKWGGLVLPGRVDSESNLGLDLWSMFHWEINVSKMFISSVYAANILILSQMELPVLHIKLTEKFVKTQYKWKHKKIPHIFLSFWKDKPINMKILLTAIMVFDSIEQYYIYHRSKRLTLKFLLRTVLSLSLTPIANGMLDWAPLPVWYHSPDHACVPQSQTAWERTS